MGCSEPGYSRDSNRLGAGRELLRNRCPQRNCRLKTGADQVLLLAMATHPPAQLNIGPALLPDFMTSAFFYCILAWPTLDEAAEFHRVAEEKIAGEVRAWLRAQPERLEELRRGWPNCDWDRYRALATKKRRVSEGRLKSRLQHRMVAARIGIGVLHDELPDVQVELPDGWTDVSIDRMCALVGEQLKIKNPENLEKLVWRPSLPIIHVAMAAQLELADKFPGEPLSNIALTDSGFVRGVACRAERYEPILALIPSLRLRTISGHGYAGSNDCAGNLPCPSPRIADY